MSSELTDALAHLATARTIADRLVADARVQLVETLRQAREDRGLTQQQVADAIGVTRTQVTNMERGDGMSVEALIGYAAAVGLRLKLTAAEPET
ncbi:helix-turn-helix transcriptional regulator [Blastococcus sp. CT_GayMR16]|uniref:helix-turn-helix transcriptional regulator n=1 Tax=Blastococcus sp. CT_GayMR16 TaxID=2559607 RepID=UPI0010746E52|nr:helix-turn-helix transcriptional regulator [Blastococcus sp. CT_GayMR16]TFV83128.1 XRE family transcriptional regulator [Blastococcus sp. CT_GayMR16]